MVKGKYTLRIRRAIDMYWRANHHPPTIRVLMRMCGLSSTSHTHYIVKSFPDVRIANGRIIPEWVDRQLDISPHITHPLCRYGVKCPLPSPVDAKPVSGTGLAAGGGTLARGDADSADGE